MTTVEQGGLRGRREVRGGGTSGYGRTGTARSIDDARSRGREALAAARGANSLALDPLAEGVPGEDRPRGSARGREAATPGRGTRDDRGRRAAGRDVPEDGYEDVVREEPRGRTAEARRRAADARGRAPEGRGTRERGAERLTRRTPDAPVGGSDVDAPLRPVRGRSDVDGGARGLGRRPDVDGASRARGRMSDVDGGVRGLGRRSDVDGAPRSRVRGSDVDGVPRSGAGRAGAVDRAAWDRDGLRRTPVERRAGRSADRVDGDLAGDAPRRAADRTGAGRLMGRAAEVTGIDRAAGRLTGRAGAERVEADRPRGRLAGRAGAERVEVDAPSERRTGADRTRGGAERVAGGRVAGGRDVGTRAAADRLTGRAATERRTTRTRATGPETRTGARDRRDAGAGSPAAVVGNLALEAAPARSSEPAPSRGGILGVVPPAPVSAPRAPFIAVVLAVVVAGVFGILVINTKINENAFKLHDARANQADLDRNEERLRGEIAMLESPNSLAAAARRMGMVPAPTPAYLKLPNGQQIGMPQPAGSPAG